MVGDYRTNEKEKLQASRFGVLRAIFAHVRTTTIKAAGLCFLIMTESQAQHREEQIEAARIEFDALFKNLCFHMPDTYRHVKGETFWATELLAWGVFLRAKGLK